MSERVWVQTLEARRLLSADVADEAPPQEAVDAEAEIIEIELDDTGSEEVADEGEYEILWLTTGDEEVAIDDEYTEWEDEESYVDDAEILIFEGEDGETVTDDEFTEWEEAIEDAEILVIDEGDGEEMVDEEDSELVDPPIDRGIIWCDEFEGEIVFWCFRGNIEGIPDGAVAKGEEVEGTAETESATPPVLLPQATETTEETDVSAAGNESATEEFLTEKDSTFDPVDALEAISA